MIDFSKLRGRIKEKNFSEKEFAKLLNMAAPTLSSKLNGITFFNTDEIIKAAKILDISEQEIYEYFFKEKTE